MSNAPYLKWQCSTCGDVYDEALGAPLDGIAPGSRFADLPYDWICPNCAATKDLFIPYVA